MTRTTLVTFQSSLSMTSPMTGATPPGRSFAREQRDWQGLDLGPGGRAARRRRRPQVEGREVQRHDARSGAHHARGRGGAPARSQAGLSGGRTNPDSCVYSPRRPKQASVATCPSRWERSATTTFFVRWVPAEWATCIWRAIGRSIGWWRSRSCATRRRPTRRRGGASIGRRRRPRPWTIPTSARSTRSGRTTAAATSSRCSTWRARRWRSVSQGPASPNGQRSISSHEWPTPSTLPTTAAWFIAT